MISVIGTGMRRRRKDSPHAIWRGGSVPVNTVVTGIRTIVRAGVAFILLPLLIHRIGQAPTGLFVFATTLTGYFTAIEYGLGMSVTKYVAEHRATGDAEQLGSILRASLALMAGIGVVAALIIMLLALVSGQALFEGSSTSSQAVPTLLVASAIALFYWPSRLGTAALQGLERYDINAVIQIGSSVLMLGLMYIVTDLTHSVTVLTAIFGAMLVVEGSVAGALAWPHLGLRRGLGRWRGAHLRPALVFGGGLFLIGMADTLIYESDRIVVTAFVGAAAVTVYEVALRPHNGARLVSGLIGAALVSTFSRLVAQQRLERLRALALVATLYSIVLTVPLVILILVFAESLLEAWIAPEYGRYAVYVQIFVSYWIVGSTMGVLSSAITGMGRIRVFVWFTVIGGLLILGLSIWLATVWGTVGVIWGTTIPAWLSAPLWMHYALRHIGISKARFAREVLVPGYLPIAVWTVPIVMLERVIDPRGLLGMGIFCAVALVALWLVLAPVLRARWRGALRDVDDTVLAPGV